MQASQGIHGCRKAAPQLHAANCGAAQAGVSLEAACDDLARIAADLAREYPVTNEGRGVALEFRDVVLGGDLQRMSLLFLGVVGFMLLSCFANIANLLLTRKRAQHDRRSGLRVLQ
jgi:hypothetical protein